MLVDDIMDDKIHELKSMLPIQSKKSKKDNKDWGWFMDESDQENDGYFDSDEDEQIIFQSPAVLNHGKSGDLKSQSWCSSAVSVTDSEASGSSEMLKRDLKKSQPVPILEAVLETVSEKHHLGFLSRLFDMYKKGGLFKYISAIGLVGGSAFLFSGTKLSQGNAILLVVSIINIISNFFCKKSESEEKDQENEETVFLS